MGFFDRLRTNRKIREKGLTPIDDMGREDIKCDMALLVKQGGTY